VKDISKLWASIALLSTGMAAVALFYQYALGTAPCVLCVHARIWTVGLIVVAVLGLALRRVLWLQPVLGITALGFSVGLGETAYSLLATERGWGFGSCNFDAGLPSWFALDEWFPAVFMPLEPCGYTPELLFGVTMAEGLMATAVILGILGVIKLGRSVVELIVDARTAQAA